MNGHVGREAVHDTLNPLRAAFIHVSSELAFILNSARVLPGVSNPASHPNFRKENML